MNSFHGPHLRVAVCVLVTGCEAKVQDARLVTGNDGAASILSVKDLVKRQQFYIEGIDLLYIASKALRCESLDKSHEVLAYVGQHTWNHAHILE